MMGDIEEIVLTCAQEQGWNTRRKGRELQVEQCVVCDNTRFNLEINLDTGEYSCWACRDKKVNGQGHFTTLWKQITGQALEWPANGHTLPSNGHTPTFKTYPLSRFEQVHQALLANQHQALDYLYGRGLTEEAIRHFRLGVTMYGFHVEGNYQEYPALLIPYTNPAKQCVELIKYRSLPPAPRAFARQKGMRSVLFNGAMLPALRKEGAQEIILCGGELDAISVWIAGKRHVVAASVGEASKGQSFPDEWVRALEGFERVVMVYDGDEKGRTSAHELRRRLGEDRVFIVEFPDGADANSILQEEGAQALARYMEVARPAPVRGVQWIADVVDGLMVDMAEGKDIDFGYSWSLPLITERFGKRRPGDLIGLAGIPGAGKTTFGGIQEGLWQACPDNPDQHPTLLICLEMHRKRLARRAIQHLLRIPGHQLDLPALMRGFHDLQRYPFHLQYHEEGKLTLSSVIETMDQTYRRFGVKTVIIDNLHFLSRAFSGNSKEELHQEGVITQTLKHWAVAHEAVVLLLAHPSKQDEDHINTAYATRGSSAVKADLDMELLMFRKNLAPRNVRELEESQMQPLLDPKTALILTKTREGAGDQNRCWLYLEGDVARFREATAEEWEAPTRAYTDH